MAEEVTSRVVRTLSFLQKFVSSNEGPIPLSAVPIPTIPLFNPRPSSAQSKSQIIGVDWIKRNERPFQAHVHTFSHTSPKSVIVDNLWPLLKFLRFCGNLPITEITNTEDGRPKKFRAKLQSKATLYAGAVGGFFLLAWIFFLVNFLLGKPWVAEVFNSIKEDEPVWSNLIRTVVKGMVMLHPITMILEIPAVWFGTRYLVPYLNNWHEIEDELKKTFPGTRFEFDLQRYRDLMAIFYVLVPSAVFVALHAGDQFLPCSNVVVNFAILLLYSFSLMVASLAEDTKVILMYRIQQQVFRWLREGITDQVDQGRQRKMTLKPEIVKHWLRILNLIRGQHDLMCKYQLYHQLFNSVCALFLYTSHLFVLFGSLRAGAGYQMTWPCLMLCTMMFGRLLFKATMAQTVTDEEHAIGTLIAQIEGSDSDMETRLEIKFMFDLIAVRPSHVTFGNFFTYNKRFLMGVVAQSVTYLIVLMQFSATIQYG